MQKSPRNDSFKRLFEIAEGQRGLFTTKQAKQAGYAENTHPYHVQVGNWLRRHRGIYQLAQYPIDQEADLVLWYLWSRDRQEKPLGVYSHETALRIHDLSDVNPSKLHMTVPKKFRRGTEIPELLSLHFADISEGDLERRQGYVVTRPLRTLTDILKEGVLADDLIAQAFTQALERGLVSKSELERCELDSELRSKLQALLREGKAA